MKTIHKLTFLLMIAFSFSSCMSGRAMTDNYAPDAGMNNATVNIFYQSLSPYGQWINYGGYGAVWVPRVARSFRPYATNGHWVYSDYGWTWMSGYRWGWAAFHYGRWAYDNYYGWIWIPGDTWAPAWVAWRHSPNYYGWAPLGPGMNINININIDPYYWTFIPGRYMGYNNINRYYQPWNRNTTIIHNTTIINNVYEQNNHAYFSGPTRRAVEQRTQQNIRPVRIANSPDPSGARLASDELRIYRPTISSDEGDHSARPVRRTTAPSTEVRTNGDNNNNAAPRREARPTRNADENEIRRSSGTENNRREAPATRPSPTREARPSRQAPSQTPARQTAPERTTRPSATPERRSTPRPAPTSSPSRSTDRSSRPAGNSENRTTRPSRR